MDSNREPRQNQRAAGWGKSIAGRLSRKILSRVQAYTVGYDREVGHIPHLATALGGQFSWYGVPGVLQPAYGAHPMGTTLFVRLRVK